MRRMVSLLGLPRLLRGQRMGEWKEVAILPQLRRKDGG
jgi:hypothetical protein